MIVPRGVCGADDPLRKEALDAETGDFEAMVMAMVD
jgi:hypothetical protein